MPSIPQSHYNEKALVIVFKDFFKHHVVKPFARCNGMNEKGVSAVSLLRFTSLLVADSVNNNLKNLIDEKRKNVFIVDDSIFNRTRCKKTKLGSRLFDHTDMYFKKGFWMLTLSWGDGNTLNPVNSYLLAFAKDTNILGLVKNFNNRTLAGKDANLLRQKLQKQ